MSGQAKDEDDQKELKNQSSTNVCPVNDLMKQLMRKFEEQDRKMEKLRNQNDRQAQELSIHKEELNHQKKKNGEMENRVRNTEENVKRVKTELEAFKLGMNILIYIYIYIICSLDYKFQEYLSTGWRRVGKLIEMSLLYLDLDSLRDIMFEQIGDDRMANEKFEKWYREKKIQKWKRIGVGFLAGGTAGTGMGGLSCAIHTPLMIAATGGAIVSSGGIVLVAMAGGLVLFGLGLGAYKLYRRYKCNQIKTAHGTKKLQVRVSFQNNDVESTEAINAG
ncbi:uncharacterized protein LOC144421037 isoform X1 [Styela clava]